MIRLKSSYQLLFTICLLSCFTVLHAQNSSPAEKLAATAMKIWNDSVLTQPGRQIKWAYDQGVVLEGIEALWNRTADARYFNYIQKYMDAFTSEDGSIKAYKQGDYNVDNIKNGRSLLLLYKVTRKPKYLKAVNLLREQLRKQPRTSEGGFWHKNIYPHQMWLDGLYMGEPFYAEYASLFREDTAFNDIAKQFILMETHARDAKTGLLYHGWDESRQQRWADKSTGRSPHFWGRAMGWYAMALVDVLDYFPQNHPSRDSLAAILNRLAVAVQKYQDPSTGLWWQVLDKGKEKGNYYESSASCMFVYALAKGIRKGYLPASFTNVTEKGYKGILSEFLETDKNGQTNLKGTVAVAGLGGNPYRDGSYKYYIGEKVISNDAKGVGAFLLASHEMELAAIPKIGNGKTVTLDSYYNNETRESPAGFKEPFHYKWEEKDDVGSTFLGYAFTGYGASINELTTAPDATSLGKTDIYLIIDPDTEKETPNPNFINQREVSAITEWVKGGGVLVLMGNDSANAEFEHFNQLAGAFGIHFNEDSKNRVPGSDFNMGKIMVPANHSILPTAKQIYIKELSTLNVQPPATAVLSNQGYVVMAVAKVGKGTVFAVGDPWLYNEYTDGRKLPAEYENYKAAKDLARWLIMQSTRK
ncbi:MAG TPA: glycoside hydrolase family 88 protein [Chitinophagaceae bacterium]|nr:glycoside hydrolase family 88 protein [Chitinophagaceae bacterium]